MKASFLLVCVLLTTQVLAQSQSSTGTISDVGFIVGSWKAVAGDRIIDATWSQPAGGNIVGYVRVMKEGKVVLYELFAFEQSQDGLAVFVRHFRPGLIASEEKENPNHYTFMEASAGRALFQKRGEDVRVRYEKRSKDEFAIVVGKPEGGEWVFKDFWVFKRVK